jgi:2-hydroxychromene-2-carboxylate isomerase
MRRADWYFDFISPFAYLQSERIPALSSKLDVRYRPVLFAGLLAAHGQKGPAEIPAKRAFTYRFVVWQARRLGIPLKFPHEHPFDPLALLRLAIACDCRPDEWAELAHDLGMPDAQARIADPEVKSALRHNTDEAIARGVFGVPTLAIGDQLFWGADATDMALDYAAGRCDDAEYARVSALPEGATREPASPRKPARG